MIKEPMFGGASGGDGKKPSYRAKTVTFKPLRQETTQGAPKPVRPDESGDIPSLRQTTKVDIADDILADDSPAPIREGKRPTRDYLVAAAPNIRTKGSLALDVLSSKPPLGEETSTSKKKSALTADTEVDIAENFGVVPEVLDLRAKTEVDVPGLPDISKDVAPPVETKITRRTPAIQTPLRETTAAEQETEERNDYSLAEIRTIARNYINRYTKHILGIQYEMHTDPAVKKPGLPDASDLLLLVQKAKDQLVGDLNKKNQVTGPALAYLGLMEKKKLTKKQIEDRVGKSLQIMLKRESGDKRRSRPMQQYTPEKLGSSAEKLSPESYTQLATEVIANSQSRLDELEVSQSVQDRIHEYLLSDSAYITRRLLTPDAVKQSLAQYIQGELDQWEENQARQKINRTEESLSQASPAKKTESRPKTPPSKPGQFQKPLSVGDKIWKFLGF